MVKKTGKSKGQALKVAAKQKSAGTKTKKLGNSSSRSSSSTNAKAGAKLTKNKSNDESGKAAKTKRTEPLKAAKAVKVAQQPVANKKLATKAPAQRAASQENVANDNAPEAQQKVSAQMSSKQQVDKIKKQKLTKTSRTGAVEVVSPVAGRAKSGSLRKNIKADGSGRSANRNLKIDGTVEDWRKLQAKFQDEKAQAYSIKGNFEALRPLQHKTFGWGWVMSNENDRLEVLFEIGKKVLISNRK